MSKTFKWILFSAIILSIVLLSIIPFLFNNSLFSNHSYLAMYLSSKIIFGLILITSLIIIFVLKLSRGMGLAIGIISISSQVIPLFIRLILNDAYTKNSSNNKPIIYSIILLLVSIFAISVSSILIAVTNKKIKISDEKYETDEITIKEGNGENNE